VTDCYALIRCEEEILKPVHGSLQNRGRNLNADKNDRPPTDTMYHYYLASNMHCAIKISWMLARFSFAISHDVITLNAVEAGLSQSSTNSGRT
jgi:hypothetical protein